MLAKCSGEFEQAKGRLQVHLLRTQSVRERNAFRLAFLLIFVSELHVGTVGAGAQQDIHLVLGMLADRAVVGVACFEQFLKLVFTDVGGRQLVGHRRRSALTLQFAFDVRPVLADTHDVAVPFRRFDGRDLAGVNFIEPRFHSLFESFFAKEKGFQVRYCVL